MASAPNKENMDMVEPERAIKQAVINARIKLGITQKELSGRTGITQSDISKIENGNANPSIKTLKRLADALGCQLKVEFIDKK